MRISFLLKIYSIKDDPKDRTLFLEEIFCTMYIIYIPNIKIKYTFINFTIKLCDIILMIIYVY